MLINRELVVEKLAAYLHHKMTVEQLVDWAERAMMDGEFDEAHNDALRTVVARLGVVDVRAFGLTWEDCQELLEQLGCSARVEIVAS